MTTTYGFPYLWQAQLLDSWESSFYSYKMASATACCAICWHGHTFFHQYGPLPGKMRFACIDYVNTGLLFLLRDQVLRYFTTGFTMQVAEILFNCPFAVLFSLSGEKMIDGPVVLLCDKVLRYAAVGIHDGAFTP